MAEQNRKTTEQKLWRMEAERVVSLYLDYVFADSDADDIARESRHILGTYSEHGSLPKGSGFAGFCKLGGKIDRMRYRDVTRPMIQAKEAMEKVGDDDQINALCVDRMYRDRTRAVATDPLNGKTREITYRTKDCARKLNISEDVYRKRVSRGYQALESVLQSRKQAA
ncbi:hypothetical protein [Marinobacter salarius]|jgi:hypothetical protein|uniref:hypothetical protein n=1 Tax=Marinobacter salarius TaxID=1420917 RepID=UPI0010AA99E7|nr:MULTISPECIES: hypothetical protein [Marinobacter]MBJ7302728.1 hypothetical protein [Marinobacter salarius]HIO30741.1 hypothetical protein [Marinobacter salarius]HIP01760.1 hypothetical protein [Marinobacter salarius]